MHISVSKAKVARRYDFFARQEAGVGQHGAGVRCMQWLPERGLLATGSWDRTVCCWDPRIPQVTMILRNGMASASMGSTRASLAWPSLCEALVFSITEANGQRGRPPVPRALHRQIWTSAYW